MLVLRKRWTHWALCLSATLPLFACEVAKTSKPKSPYRAPVAGNSGVTAESGTAEVATNLTVSVTVKDKSGYGIPNVVPTITAVDSTGSSSGVSSGGCGGTNSKGVATCSISATYPGTYTIKTLTPVQTTTGSTVSFYQLPRSLSFSQQPSSTSEASTAFATQPKVTVLDKAGRTYPDPVTVTVSLTSAAGATLSTSGSLSVATASGVATFAGLKVNKVGSYTLTAAVTHATAGTITTSSSSLAITAAAPAKLAFKVSPSSSSATGVAFAQQPQVVLTDADGNTINATNTTNTTYLSKANTCVVNLTLIGGETDANHPDSLMGTTLTKTMTDGLADYSGQNLKVNRSGYTPTPLTDYQLRAVGSGTCALITSGAPYLSDAFTVTLAGLPYQLVVIQPPGTAALNEIWTNQPIIGVLDADGQLVTTDNTTQVIMAVDASSPSGSLVGSTSISVAGGVALFSGLKVTGTSSTQKGTYRYDFSGVSPGLTISGISDVAQVITDNGLTPYALRFRVQPSNVAINEPMSQIEVMTVDSNGYYCANDNATKVVLSYFSQVSGNDGSIPGGSGGNMKQGSPPFPLPEHDALVFVLPSGSNSTSINNVDITSEATVVNGIAVFRNISFSSSGAKQLAAFNITDSVTVIADDADADTTADTTFTVGTLRGVLSDVFSISNFGTADHLNFIATDSNSHVIPDDDNTTGVGSPWTYQPQVEVVDKYNNRVTNDNTTVVTVACVSLGMTPACSLAGTQTLTVTNGVAAFSDLRLNNTTADQTGVTLGVTSSPSYHQGFSRTFNQDN